MPNTVLYLTVFTGGIIGGIVISAISMYCIINHTKIGNDKKRPDEVTEEFSESKEPMKRVDVTPIQSNLEVFFDARDQLNKNS